jgi:tetratricopeptide (TPR) repeat protein
MSADARLVRGELAVFLERRLSEAESPPARDAERLRRLHAYFDSLRGPDGTPRAQGLLASGAPGDTFELACALLDRLSVDPPVGELVSTLYERLGERESEVLALALELGVAEGPRRERIGHRLSELVQVGGRETLFRSLIDMADDRETKGDLLIRLGECAIEAHAVEQYVSLADETIAALSPSSAETVRELKRVRARVLGSDPSDQGQAAQAYKELIAAFASDDDVHDFEAFIESRPSAEARHQERRWLFEWRASSTSHRTDVLAAWAAAEEEYGEPDTAIGVYQRLFALDPTRTDALEALSRLKLATGDYEGALEPLRALRDLCGAGERGARTLEIARLLLEMVDRPVETAEALAPLLAEDPPLPEAHEMARQLLADVAARGDVVERFAQLADAADALSGLRIFLFLVQARQETRGMEQRRRWLSRVAELSSADPQTALPAIVLGAGELPDALALWDAAERIARKLGKTDAISLAYFNVLAARAIEPALAETLGRRMESFEQECATGTGRLIDALPHVLEVAPEARWALDRIKLVIGSQGRWEELFHLYDRAIGAARTDRERSELLEEAAFAAKDLAVDPPRAIHYLELAHALRSDKVTIRTSLERLYERQGQTQELIELLGARVFESTGFERRHLRRRIADLWIDVGNAEAAMAVVQQGIDDDASIADMVDVLERLVGLSMPGARLEAWPREARAASEGAIDLLRRHYESAGRAGDLVRLAETALSVAQDAPARSRSIRGLAALFLREAASAPDGFDRVFQRIQPYVADNPFLAKIVYKMLLVRAVVARKQSQRSCPAGDPAHKDADRGAWTAIVRLTPLLLHAADRTGARRLLYRASRLPFEHDRRRALLADAGLVASQRREDQGRAIRIFDELFGADGGDRAASRSLAKYSELLAEAGEHAKLANLFEDQARLHGASGGVREECAFWERAAQLWEEQGAEPRAVFAYGQAATLGSEASFTALARIHARSEQWADAARALQWLYAHAAAADRGARAMRLSEAYAAIGERERARACLEDALAATDTEDAGPARERLIALYRQDAVWEPLARLLASEAGRIEDVAGKAPLLREAADLFRWRLSDPSRAASLLEAAVAHSPHDGTLRPALSDVLEALERWQDAADALKGQIDWYGETRSKERALTHQRRARALIRAAQGRDALGELRIAADMYAGEPTILGDLARVALDRGELELAESTYRVLLLALHHRAPGTGPDRAGIFLDLSEIATRHDDPLRAADLVDSAFDAAAEQGDDPVRLEETLGARGRHDLLARAVERRVQRASTLTDRAVALGHLASLWSQRLARSPDLAPRIHEYTAAIGRDIDREELTDAVAWTALSVVQAALGDDGSRLGGRDRLAAIVETTLSKMGTGKGRTALSLTLARMLLDAPARTEAAIAVLASVHQDDPSSLEATALLSDALEREGRFEELAAVLRPLAHSAAVCDAGEFVSTTLRLGRALEEIGRGEEALALYEAALDRHPIDREIIRELTARLERLASARLAECLELWMGADTNVAPAIAERLVVLREMQGDAEGVARALELGVAASPRNAELRERLVRTYGQLGKWGEAVRILRRAAEAEPEDRTILRQLAAACQRDGLHHEGIRLVDAAIARRPLDVELLTLRASLREGAGDDHGARSDLECALSADGNSGDALVALLERIVERSTLPGVDDGALRLVGLLIEANQTDRARRHLEALLARRPNHIGGLRLAASLAAAEGNTEAAVAAYRNLLFRIGTEPSELLPSVAAALVDICERTGHIEQARAPVEHALGLLPDSPELLRQLERICESSGDRGRLVEVLLARAHREDDAAEKNRIRLRAAELLLAAGTLSDAMIVIEQVLAMDPGSVEGMLLAAQAYVAFGRPHDALVLLGEAVEWCDGRRTPLLARVYVEMGKAHLAVDEVFEALDALDYGFALDRRNDEAALLLGLVAIDLDDEKTAESALLAITTMPPRKDASGVESDASTKAVAFCHLAFLAYAHGDVGKARRLANKAVGSDDCAHSAAHALLERLDVHESPEGAPL